ncbi:MAG: M50 family metallopeptidase [Cytophagales bacterium]|nr:M50 family metallopeptidase [Armatimonadota bacterium]
MHKNDAEGADASRSLASERHRESGTLLLATIFGVPFRIHRTFALLLFAVTMLFAALGSLHSLLILSLALVVITVHETGHAFAARWLGYPVRSVILSPFSGMAPLHSPDRPKDEFWVAIAGPAANLLVAALTIGVLSVTNQDAGVLRSISGSAPAGTFLFLNLFLALANLVPAFPMDGGQALRGVLSSRVPRVKATQIVVAISRLIAIACVAIGVAQGSFYWSLFAILVALGTSREQFSDDFFLNIQGMTVEEVMLREVRTLPLDQTLGNVSQEDLPKSQNFFPVTCGDEVLGIVSRGAIEKGLRSGKGAAYIAELMNRQMAFVSPDEPLKTALERSRSAPGLPLLVMDSRQLVGMVTLESVQQHIMNRRASSVQKGQR